MTPSGETSTDWRYKRQGRATFSFRAVPPCSRVSMLQHHDAGISRATFLARQADRDVYSSVFLPGQSVYRLTL